MKEIFDVSLTLSGELAGWPGDTDFSLQLQQSELSGSTITIGGATMSLHAGTHVDAPFHFSLSGSRIDQLPLDLFLGRAQLLDVTGRDLIHVDDLAQADLKQAPRLLLRTRGWPDHRTFPRSIPVLSPEVPEFLGEQGIVLLGVDVPSVDPLDSKTLPNHHALHRHGIVILESLDLREPPPGLYELHALPLKIQHGDAAPVRAVLKRVADPT